METGGGLSPVNGFSEWHRYKELVMVMRAWAGRQRTRLAFTLIELLVVVAIIALLIAILIPSLGKARVMSKRASCGANLAGVGKGIYTYQADYDGTFPAAYNAKGAAFQGGQQGYVDGSGTFVNQTGVAGPNNLGYTHLSGLIFGSANTSDTSGASGNNRNTLSWKVWLCPGMEKGGLPPTNQDRSGNNPYFDSSSANEVANVTDEQPPRVAYTMNEAVFPRNKFVIGFQNKTPVNTYKWVRMSEITSPVSSTIAATEFPEDWRIVASGSNTGVAGQTVSKSHRPVHPYIEGAAGSYNATNLDLAYVPTGSYVRRAKPSELQVYNKGVNGGTYTSRLDWVGTEQHAGKTNFLYLDGHVETKKLSDTLDASGWEWGDALWSIPSVRIDPSI